ncbi:MAG TPA: extracellular solute-binding protein [Thermomicrobiaceae bacterium]|nr:extracellular solute-binding protein [Thermomicrobiaceae bacterium]
MGISHPGRRGARLLFAPGLCLVLLLAAACGSASSANSDESATATPGGSSSRVTLTLYSGQHEDLAKALAAGFEQASGITVEVRAGSDADLANQIIEEGDRSKADVFITEEPGQAAVLDAQGLFVPVDPATLAKTDARFNPKSGNWLAYAARSRAIFYNPSLISESDLPTSILDLTKPEWKGKFAYAPSGAFVGTVTYLINTIGEEQTLAWLKGIKANGENLQKNGAVRDAVEAGQISFGLSNHYYWYILAQQKGGPDKLASKVHFMSGGDAGALLLASGAGIPKASKHQAEAQRFLAWLADPQGGQQIIATTTPQYPLAAGVQSTMGLKPLSALQPPDVDQGSFGNVDKAKDLITQAGII